MTKSAPGNSGVISRESKHEIVKRPVPFGLLPDASIFVGSGGTRARIRPEERWSNKKTGNAPLGTAAGWTPWNGPAKAAT
jgi:hypothetical protein